MTKRTTKLSRTTVGARLGVCAAALGGTAAIAPNAQAQIVNFTTPIPVPATTAGVYINLLTGATGTSAAAVPGWDFNPYSATTNTQLGFYWAANSFGGVAATTTGPYLDLATGTLVGLTSVYTRSIVGTNGSPFHVTGTRILGFAFTNEGTATTNYGYLTMTVTTGTPSGFPATVTGWSFQSNGSPITVPEPSSLALTGAAMAFGTRGVRRWRKQQAA